MPTTKEVLLKAAEVAERLDHCKGLMTLRHLDNTPYACCTLGAVSIAIKELGLDNIVRDDGIRSNAAYTAECNACDALYDAKPEFRGEIGYWNDKPETTKQDVIDFLRSTAEAQP